MSVVNLLGKFLGVAAISSMAVAGAGPALAYPKNAYVHEYYFDANFVQYAGTRTLGCSGGQHQDGVTTQYKLVVVTIDCGESNLDCDWSHIGGGDYICM